MKNALLSLLVALSMQGLAFGETSMNECEEWNKKASRCPKAAEGFSPYHQWMPISKTKTASSESVTMIMCGLCFHEINISEAFKYRNCFKDL